MRFRGHIELTNCYPLSKHLQKVGVGKEGALSPHVTLVTVVVQVHQLLLTDS